MTKKILATTIASLGLLALSGCDQVDSDADILVEELNPIGVEVYYSDELPSSFDPFYANVHNTQELFTPIFDIDDNGRIHSLFFADGLTVKSEQENGATQYQLALKPNLVWSDGTPITAADVKFTLERAQTYFNKNQPAVGTKTLPSTAIENVESNGLATTFTSSLPIFELEYRLAAPELALVPEHASSFANPESLVSFGPYNLIEYDKASHVRYQANTQYPTQPKSEFLTNRPYRWDASVAKVTNGDRHVPAAAQKFVLASESIPLNIRQALNASLDRTQLGELLPTENLSIIAPYVPALSPNDRYNQILEQEGYTESNPLLLTMIVTSSDSWIALGNAIEKDLEEKLPVDIAVNPIEFTYFKDMNDFEGYDLKLGGWAMALPHEFYYWKYLADVYPNASWITHLPLVMEGDNAAFDGLAAELEASALVMPISRYASTYTSNQDLPLDWFGNIDTSLLEMK